MIDVQKVITDIILYRIKKVTGGIMVFIGFFLIVGCEETIKTTNDWCLGYIITGMLLIAIGCKLSEIFRWEYEICNWERDYGGAVSYSFTVHSWIMAYFYTTNDNWTYVLCDLQGHILSKPIRTSKSFLGFKWYSL